MINIRTVKIVSSIFLALFSMGIFSVSPAHAVTTCGSNDIACLNAQKKALEDQKNAAAQQKAQQQSVASLISSEINALNANITSTQSAIDKITQEAVDAQSQIARLNKEIALQTSNLNSEKQKLDDALAGMYIDSANSSPLLDIAGAGNVSDAVSVQQSYQAVEMQIDQTAAQIEQIRAQLDSQKSDLTKKENSLNTLKDQQVQQREAIKNQKELKDKLLASASASIATITSTINSYNSELRAVDGRISSFLAEMQARQGAVAASGDLVVTNTQSWHYSQRDPRWADLPLDSSSSNSDTFAESGCLVTSVTMVANRFGISGTPPQILSRLRSAGSMAGDLLMWGGVSDALGGTLRFAGGGKEVTSWGAIDRSLSSGYPVIVHVRGGSYGHWVVVSSKIGDKYAVEDPYFDSGQIYSASRIDYMARLQPN